MTDLSEYSDAEILALAGGGGGGGDPSSYSDAELLQIAGVQPEPEQGLYDYAMGGLKGIAKAGTDVIAAPADLMFRAGNYALDKTAAASNALLGTNFEDNTNLQGAYPSDYRDSLVNYLSGNQGNQTAEDITHIGGNVATLVAAPSQAKNIAAKALPYISKVPGASSIAALLGLGVEGAGQSILMNPKGNLGTDAALGAGINIGAAGIGKGLGKLYDYLVPTQGAANRGAQKLATKIVDDFREVTPDAFSSAATLEDRATQAALALNKSARTARQEAGKLFQNLPTEPVVLDDAIKNISNLSEQVQGPVTPGGKSSSILNYLKGLKPVDEIIDVPPSTILDEFGRPAIPGRSEVILGGPAKVPLNEVQNILRDVGKVANNADGVDRMLLSKAREEIMNAAEKSVSPSSMDALREARKAWSEMAKTYDDSAVGAVRKSLLEPGKRLSTLKTKLLSDPKSAEELTRVMTPKELSNVQNLVLMDLTAKQPVTWERAISQKYDSYKHIFGEANTEKLLQMVSREGSIGSKLLKDNNGLGGLLAKTGLKGAIGGSVGYQATGDWKGAAIGSMLAAGKGRLEGKVVNQAKSLIMRAAIGSPEALKILGSVPKNAGEYIKGLERLVTPIAAGVKREFSQEETKQQPLQTKIQSPSSFNSDRNFIDSKVEKAEAILDSKPEIVRASRIKQPIKTEISREDVEKLGKSGPIETQKRMERDVIKYMREGGMSEAEAKEQVYKDMKNEGISGDDFISKEEGGQALKGYYPKVKGSGVTVASGVDIGSRSPDDIDALGISNDLKTKLKPYAGKKDALATKILERAPLRLSKAEATELDDAVKEDIYGTIATKLKEVGVDLSKLPAEAQTVVKSLAWNFGKNFDDTLPSIWKAITEKDWATVQAKLINTKWKQPELKDRRLREAALLDPLVAKV